uniref:BZIP domain-containing protein n=1 Tax=Meloidogyne hapla TaxID=6305 RepID=A0A1I8B283_MELHA
MFPEEEVKIVDRKKHDHHFDIDDNNALSPNQSNNPLNDYKKQARAQHNALERRRRDNIKDASRAQILRKAYETIQTGNEEVKELNREVDKIEELNQQLRKQLENQTKVTR